MEEKETCTKLKEENITNASEAIKTYINTCQEYFATIDKEINELRESGFIGDASDGYATFYSKLKKNLTDNFYGNNGTGEGALLPGLCSWLESGLVKLVDTLDPKLKNQNVGELENSEVENKKE